MPDTERQRRLSLAGRPLAARQDASLDLIRDCLLEVPSGEAPAVVLPLEAECHFIPSTVRFRHGMLRLDLTVGEGLAPLLGDFFERTCGAALEHIHIEPTGQTRCVKLSICVRDPEDGQSGQN